jgi:ankyrin repeat protein
MRKVAIVLSIFALIASSCGQRNTKKQAETDKISDIYAQLIKAIETDDQSVFDELINQVTDIDSLIQVNETDYYSYSLLGYACKYKRCWLAEKLINLKADINVGNSDEYLVFDALSVAVESEDLCLVKLLLKNGADPNRLNSEDGFTVLSLSCKLNNYDIAKLLIENSANVDGAGDTGFDYIHYPLLHAVETNNIKLVQLLIDNGCKIDVRDKQGETPFTIAERNENQQMSDLLLEELLKQRTLNNPLGTQPYENEE